MRTLSFSAAMPAAISLLALAGCSDNSVTRPMTPATASFGKNVTGTNQRLLFTSMRDGNEEIYSINPDGTGATRLTYTPQNDAYAVWSPDGKRIAFTSWRDNGSGDIYVMNADGSNVVRLTNSVGSSQQPTWSKDGKQIAFMSNRDGANAASYIDLNEFEIYVMNADGTNQTRLTNNVYMDASPVWSPDGKQLAFSSNRDNYFGNDIFLMSPDGTLVTRLTSAESGIHANLPAWEPHGRNIVFQREGGIFTIDPVSRLQTQLTHVSAPSGDMGPSYSPDGGQIAFTSTRTGGFELYTMNSDGSQMVQITSNIFIDFLVRWSR